MVEERIGDLFEADVDALVNAVNCVGVMGKGLALAFKQRYPDNFETYRLACGAGQVQPGQLFTFRSSCWIINFPTKRHWRDPSQLEDIRSGLVALIDEVDARGIQSIAIPALGCGLGGLAWSDVRPLIIAAVAVRPEVRFVVFPPG